MRKSPFHAVLALILLLSGALAGATKDACPPVTEQSILGVWEAVYTADTVRVFRLELRDEGPSVLAQGVGYGNSYVSILTGKSIVDGKVKLSFKNSMTPLKIIVRNQSYTTTGEDVLEGTGRFCQGQVGGSGVLDLSLTNEPALPDPKKWALRFIRPEKGLLVDELREMSHAAMEAATVAVKARQSSLAPSSKR